MKNKTNSALYALAFFLGTFVLPVGLMSAEAEKYKVEREVQTLLESHINLAGERASQKLELGDDKPEYVTTGVKIKCLNANSSMGAVAVVNIAGKDYQLFFTHNSIDNRYRLESWHQCASKCDCI